MAAYPRPILDYESARRGRLAALEQRQRHWQPGSFTGLPNDVTPFGADRIPGVQVGWASLEGQELFPAGLDPAALDRPALECLASWFETRPQMERKGPATGSAARRSRLKPADAVQLSLLDQA